MDIIDAILKNNIEILLAYLLLGGDPNFCEDLSGVTLLHHAVSVRNFAAIGVLLFCGANPLQRDYLFNESPFELAMSVKCLPAAILMVTQMSDQFH